jgi:hypothetical protein
LLTQAEFAVTMKLRSLFYILATFVLALLIVGAAGFYWLTAQNPLGLLRNQAANPSAAIFVSRQAPVMASLLVNPDRLESFSRVVVSPGERRQARAELAQLKQSLLSSTGLDYQQDIQPWLGNEVTLALTTLDIDRDEENGRQPGYLIALASQNPERSREFLQLFWQKRALTGADLVFEQYKGVKLIYAEPGKTQPLPANRSAKAPVPGDDRAITPTLTSAVVGDRFVLFANHPKVLREAVNNVQAEDLNLASSPFYQKALENLKPNRIGLAVVNLPRLTTWLGNTQTLLKPSATPDQSVEPAYEGLVVSLGLNPQGLLAETALLGATSQNATTPRLTQPVGALQYLPASSPVSASGKDLHQLWQQVSRGLSSYGVVSQFVNQSLTSLQEQWGIQLAEDVFDWVDGEYALGVLPSEVREKNSASLANWIFVAERSNLEATQSAIEHLDTIARQQGLSVGPLKLDNQDVSVWTRLSTVPLKSRNGSVTLQADIRGVHASVGQYEIFTTSVEAMDSALKATRNPLPTSEQFTQAIRPLLQPNNGYLYLDWRTAQPLLERQFPLFKVVELAGKPFLSHVRSLTISSYGSQNGVQRGGVFIKLGKL